LPQRLFSRNSFGSFFSAFPRRDGWIGFRRDGIEPFKPFKPFKAFKAFSEVQRNRSKFKGSHTSLKFKTFKSFKPFKAFRTDATAAEILALTSHAVVE
jgi:hypothetical protein